MIGRLNNTSSAKRKMVSQLTLRVRPPRRNKINMRLYQLLRSVAVLAIISTTIGGPSVTPAQAQHSQPIGNITALNTLLNPDGTLNLQSGFNGSFDARGWSLTTTADGRPRFINAAQSGTTRKPNIAGDEAWNVGFVNGVSSGPYAANVYAVAVVGSDVYIGGSFIRLIISPAGARPRISGMRSTAVSTAARSMPLFHTETPFMWAAASTT